MALDKEEVASAFEKHFDELGWESTSITDVARALNTTKQAVYKQFNPDSEGYDVDFARFRSQLGDGPSGHSVEPERLFEERLKHGVTDFLLARRATRCCEIVRSGLESRDDPHEKLLYLVHASMATARVQSLRVRHRRGASPLTDEFSRSLPRMVAGILANGIATGGMPNVAVDDTGSRIVQILVWSMELIETETLDLHALRQLQEEVTDGVLGAVA